MRLSTWSIPFALLLVAGCGGYTPIGLDSAPGGAQLAARSDVETQAQFIASDPTFQPTGTGNAFKVAEQEVADNAGLENFVGVWYRDLTGYFGNAQAIQAVFGPAGGRSGFQTFTLTLLRPSFYQMPDTSEKSQVQGAAVIAFHGNGKWDSNQSRNYGIHFQAFPTQQW